MPTLYLQTFLRFARKLPSNAAASFHSQDQPRNVIINHLAANTDASCSAVSGLLEQDETMALFWVLGLLLSLTLSLSQLLLLVLSITLYHSFHTLTGHTHTISLSLSSFLRLSLISSGLFLFSLPCSLSLFLFLFSLLHSLLCLLR